MPAGRSCFFLLLVLLQLSCVTRTVTPDGGAAYRNENGRNDRWGFAGFGGGGAMFYPAVSPFDPSFALVACDMTGSYVTYDGGERWRMFNLGDPVTFFLFDPNDSNVVYANAAALYKSTDKGNTWRLFYPAEEDIAGIISKGDHATTIVVPKDSISRRVSALGIDPADSRILFAGITVDGQHGIFTSPDGGKTWQKETGTDTAVKNIFTAPASDHKGRVYASTEKGIYVKTENGWRFNKAPAGVRSVTTFTAGFDATQQKTIIYGITGLSYFNNTVDSSGIFYTNDGGETWENRQGGLTSLCDGCTPEWRTVATSTGHPHTVYVSYNNFTNGDTVSIGVAKSTDFGITWSLVWQDRLLRDTALISSNFSRDWLNERFGPSWGENPFSIGVSPHNPDICYATDFGRTVKTEDGGKYWQQVYSKETDAGWVSRGLEVTTSYDIVMDPFDSSHLFICNTDIGLMESEDGGHSWKSATKNNGIPRSWINSTYWLAFDPEVKGRAWAVMSGSHDLPRPKMWRRSGVSGYKGGILTTTDGGKTWIPVSKSAGEGAFTHILVDPESNRHLRTLYACGFGKGVYKSTDGGKTWKQKNTGLPAAEPFAWRISRRENDGALFLVISRRNEKDTEEGDGALYVSRDGAETWQPINLPAGTNGPTDIMPDNTRPGRLILSAWGKINEGRFEADTGGGIFMTEDEGQTWKQVMEKDQHVHDITYDSRSSTYYACGFNGNAWRSADGARSWQRIKGYNFKWGKRVVPDPHDKDRIFIITFGGGVWHGPANGDSLAAEDILSIY